MQRKITEAVEAICQKLYGICPVVVLSIPDEQFGDVSTNVAMQLAKPLGKNPRDIAREIVSELTGPPYRGLISQAGVAGPGFINLTYTDTVLAESITARPDPYLSGMSVVVEFSDPNPFKVLHAGHFYTSIVGDAISRLYEAVGASVHRVNFGGDVGLHVAKAMWGIVRELGGEFPEGLKTVAPSERPDWISARYVAGNAAYESDEQAKAEITALNKRIYELHFAGDRQTDFAKLYWTCRQWSYDYFEEFYRQIGVTFEKYYPESETTVKGLATVKEQLERGVYTESDGAVVFEGEPYGLHTRVFINSAGLPTYETKDVGLLLHKWNDYAFDVSVMITGNDIREYMKVVLKSIERYEPELVRRSVHIMHGMIKLKGGAKMSSRLGNYLKATDVLAIVRQAAPTGTVSEATVLAAIKYSFLKQSIGQDIAFDPVESVAQEGNSGPYLQYAHARACSILAKAAAHGTPPLLQFDAEERKLAVKLSQYPEVIAAAAKTMTPHDVCGYLYGLSQTFNKFYENAHVIGSEREPVRLWLVAQYATVLKDGLSVLGIEAPDSM